MPNYAATLKVKASAVESWPVIWRVVAPACGSYEHDMVFIETDSEEEARRKFHGMRCAEWPVRLERVQCGPLPTNAMASLRLVRAATPQNPKTPMREIAGYWEVPHG